MRTLQILPIACLFFSAYCTAIIAQPTFRSGALPAVNINTRLADKWKVNVKNEFRIITGNTDEVNRPDGSSIEFAFSDLSIVFSRKIGLAGSVAAGSLLRIRTDGNHARRFIQQYTTVGRFAGYRLAHRFSADQTLDNDQPATLRIRYRLATELPLGGQAVDPMELYLKFSNEYLSIWRGDSHDFEIRMIPALGYAITDHNKVECAIDYRLDRLRLPDQRHTIWLSLTWYVVL